MALRVALQHLDASMWTLSKNKNFTWKKLRNKLGCQKLPNVRMPTRIYTAVPGTTSWELFYREICAKKKKLFPVVCLESMCMHMID